MVSFENLAKFIPLSLPFICDAIFTSKRKYRKAQAIGLWFCDTNFSFLYALLCLSYFEIFNLPMLPQFNTFVLTRRSMMLATFTLRNCSILYQNHFTIKHLIWAKSAFIHKEKTCARKHSGLTSAGKLQIQR